MENSKTLTTGASVDNIDLTLRLGLPFQDTQKQEDAKGNSLKQDGEENASNKVFSISGSNDAGSSRAILKKCTACESDDTPLWRKGPHGPRTLCNACGLRYARLMKRPA